MRTNSARWCASTRRRRFCITSTAGSCNMCCDSCWRQNPRRRWPDKKFLTNADQVWPRINAKERESGVESDRECRRTGKPGKSLHPDLYFLFLLVLPVFFIRLGENFPQRLAAVDDLLASAFWALILAHITAGEGGALDLVHLNGAVGTSCIVHGSKCSS